MHRVGADVDHEIRAVRGVVLIGNIAIRQARVGGCRHRNLVRRVEGRDHRDRGGRRDCGGRRRRWLVLLLLGGRRLRRHIGGRLGHDRGGRGRSADRRGRRCDGSGARPGGRGRVRGWTGRCSHAAAAVICARGQVSLGPDRRGQDLSADGFDDTGHPRLLELGIGVQVGSHVRHHVPGGGHADSALSGQVHEQDAQQHDDRQQDPVTPFAFSRIHAFFPLIGRRTKKVLPGQVASS